MKRGEPTLAPGRRSATIGRMTRTAKLAMVTGALVVAGCGTGQEVTPEAIGEARARWEKVGLEDYDLEWLSSGMRTAHYRVAVRGGKVVQVVALLPDGRQIKQKPADMRPYGVDGLFDVIADEQAQLKADRPFGMPKGTAAVLRFEPDPERGYPRNYRRDVMGSPKSVAIDVVKLEPNSDEPPEPTGP